MADDCCATEPPTQTTPAAPGSCPGCGAKGKAVDTLTVKALLAVPLYRLEEKEYRFCATPDCSTVYYSLEGRQQFTEAELREQVHQKHPDDPNVQVCYCFRHTPAAIQAELAVCAPTGSTVTGTASLDQTATGRSTVAASITAGIKAGQCACEVRNPQGSCCLGNVQAVVRALRQELKAKMAKAQTRPLEAATV